ncbi:MAG: DMT family transporter [Propionibacteriaceae bacterium]
MLSAGVVLAVLGAAVLHAVWNTIAHQIADRVLGFALIGVVDLVAGVALLLVFGLPPAAAWPYAIASGVVHVFYNLLLLRSYQLGDFSQSYPLARGVAPGLVAAFSVLVLGRTLDLTQAVGIGVICLGLVSLVFAGGRPHRSQAPALGAAVATGVMIATYTIIDGLAVESTELVPYIGAMFALQGLVLPFLVVRRPRHELALGLRRHGRAGLAGGVIGLAAYSIVLWAQTSGALAPIAALRETSIVWGALIGAVLLHERLGWWRSAAAVVVLAGVALISLG